MRFLLLTVLGIIFLVSSEALASGMIKPMKAKKKDILRNEQIVTTRIYVYEDPETGERFFSNLRINEHSKLYLEISAKRPLFMESNQDFKNPIASQEFKLNPKFGEVFQEVAVRYNLDPKLLQAIAKVESNYNPRAISPKGAMGVMQLIPSTARLMGVEDPFNPKENIYGGAKYLRYLLDKFRDLSLALAAYNAGPKAVEVYGGIPPYSETRSYVNHVLSLYQRLK